MELQNVVIPPVLASRAEEAKVLMYDKLMEYFLMWFGGHGVHAYNKNGHEVAFWNVGDFRFDDAEKEKVVASMKERIKNLDYVDYS